MIFTDYSFIEALAIILPIFFLGMSKGGFPVGVIALPLLILFWPGEGSPATAIVAFMLPLLCCMDIVAVVVYRNHIQWRRIMALIPGSLIGILTASVFFLSEDSFLLRDSDRWLKLMIGVIGLSFILYKIIGKRLLSELRERRSPAGGLSHCLGFLAGITSTVAHAAAPLAQMYFLISKLPKMQFAASIAGYFFILNLVKLIPFIGLGRLDSEIALLSASLLPIVPVGVFSGYFIVRQLKGTWYIAFIHLILFFTSTSLIYEAVTKG